MDWSKVDAGLAAALADDDPARRYTVFVHLVPEADADAEPLGVDSAGDGPVRTATLSSAEIGHLSERAGVRLLRLSAPLKPAEQP